MFFNKWKMKAVVVSMLYTVVLTWILSMHFPPEDQLLAIEAPAAAIEIQGKERGPFALSITQGNKRCYVNGIDRTTLQTLNETMAAKNAGVTVFTGSAMFDRLFARNEDCYIFAVQVAGEVIFSYQDSIARLNSLRQQTFICASLICLALAIGWIVPGRFSPDATSSDRGT